MSERFTVVLRPEAPYERFAPGAFAPAVGELVPVTGVNGKRMEGEVVASGISSDGSEATLTIEVPDGALWDAPQRLFGFPAYSGSVGAPQVERGQSADHG